MIHKLSAEQLNDLLDNPDIINAVINTINNNLRVPYPHNIYSYFLTGHCNVYAEILDNIFNDNLEFYINDKESHIIVKIKNHFYDVNGFIDYMNLEDYNFIDKNLFYYLVDIKSFGNYDKNIDKNIVEYATSIGKNELFNIINLHSKESKRIKKLKDF